MRRILRIFVIVATVSILAVLIGGYFTPFEDRQGRCTICGENVYEKYTPLLGGHRWTFEMPSEVSRFYNRHNLGAHEHNWEYMGGFTRTNLYGYPAEYIYGPSDPLLLVPDDFMVEILMRLETREDQQRFIRALNDDDPYIRDQTRSHLYAAFPNSRGSLMEWWEIYKAEKDGIFVSSLIPHTE
jgi:hypothetical protein